MIEVLHKCSRCPRWAPRTKEHFAWTRREDREYLLSYCRECGREARRKTRAKNPDIYRENTQRWRAKNPEGRKRLDRRYNSTDAGRRRLKRAERLSRILAVAPIPTPVVKPFVEQACRELARFAGDNVKGEIPGQTQLAEATGVNQRRIYDILNNKSRSVSIDIADALCTEIGTSLPELVERAREWAVLTGDPWPHGYKLDGRLTARCSLCSRTFLMSKNQQKRYIQGEYVFCSQSCASGFVARRHQAKLRQAA